MTEETKRLTFSKISSMTDANELVALIEVLETEASHIEAQLDHASEEQTVEWEKSAISALGYKRAQAGCARRILHNLNRKQERNEKRQANEDKYLSDAILSEAKAQKRLAAVENRRIDWEMAKVKKDRETEAQKERVKLAMMKASQKLSTDSIWRVCAMDLFGKEECERVNALMIERYGKALERFSNGDPQW